VEGKDGEGGEIGPFQIFWQVYAYVSVCLSCAYDLTEIEVS